MREEPSDCATVRQASLATSSINTVCLSRSITRPVAARRGAARQRAGWSVGQLTAAAGRPVDSHPRRQPPHRVAITNYHYKPRINGCTLEWRAFKLRITIQRPPIPGTPCRYYHTRWLIGPSISLKAIYNSFLRVHSQVHSRERISTFQQSMPRT